MYQPRFGNRGPKSSHHSRDSGCSTSKARRLVYITAPRYAIESNTSQPLEDPKPFEASIPQALAELSTTLASVE